MPSTNGHGPKRAILYACVTTDEQARNGFSLGQQLEALCEYASREAGTTWYGASKPIGGRGHTAALYSRLAQALGVETTDLMINKEDLGIGFDTTIDSIWHHGTGELAPTAGSERNWG